MRRLWMSALLAPALALTVPAMFLSAPAALAAPAAFAQSSVTIYGIIDLDGP